MKKLNVLFVSLIICGSLQAADEAKEKLASGAPTDDGALCLSVIKPWADEAQRLASIAVEAGKKVGIGVVNGAEHTWSLLPAFKDMRPSSGDPFKQLDDDPAFTDSINK